MTKMIVQDFDTWRLHICKNVTIQNKTRNSEDIRVALHLSSRREAVAYMKAIADEYPSSFEYKVERQRAILTYLGGI